MGTSWSEIISDHAMVFIDDVRLTDQAAESLIVTNAHAIVRGEMPELKNAWLVEEMEE